MASTPKSRRKREADCDPNPMDCGVAGFLPCCTDYEDYDDSEDLPCESDQFFCGTEGFRPCCYSADSVASTGAATPSPDCEPDPVNCGSPDFGSCCDQGTTEASCEPDAILCGSPDFGPCCPDSNGDSGAACEPNIDVCDMPDYGPCCPDPMGSSAVSSVTECSWDRLSCTVTSMPPCCERANDTCSLLAHCGGDGKLPCCLKVGGVDCATHVYDFNCDLGGYQPCCLHYESGCSSDPDTCGASDYCCSGVTCGYNPNVCGSGDQLPCCPGVTQCSSDFQSCSPGGEDPARPPCCTYHVTSCSERASCVSEVGGCCRVRFVQSMSASGQQCASRSMDATCGAMAGLAPCCEDLGTGDGGTAGLASAELASLHGSRKEWDSCKAFLNGVSEHEENDFVKLVQLGQMVDQQDVVELLQFAPDELDYFGFSAEEFLMECTMDRANCGSTNFKRLVSPRYGNCLTFNSAYQANSSVRRTLKSGSRFGLRVTLNIWAAEYVGLLAQEAGVRVSVHPPDVHPEPEDDGFLVSPGKLSSVGLKRREVKRLAAPYESQCLSAMPEDLAPYAVDESVYTIRQCEKACHDKWFHKLCGCVDQVIPLSRAAGNASEPGQISRCQVLNRENRECKAEVLGRETLPMEDVESTACDCRPQCTEVFYEPTLSTTRWPTSAYEKLKIINFVDKNPVAKYFLKDRIAEEKLRPAGWESVSPDFGFDTDHAKEHTFEEYADFDYVEDSWLGMEDDGWHPNAEALNEVKTDGDKNLVRLHIYYESLTYKVSGMVS